MPGCYLRIKEILNTLPPREQRAASYILNHPSEATLLSVEELAAACNISTASVIRMCKKLGYSGYKEFSRMLSNDLVLTARENISYSEIHPGDSVESIADNVIRGGIKALENTLSLLDMNELNRAVDALCAARRVDFYGVGSSGVVAMDAHNKFLRIDKVSMSSADPHTQILSATSLRPQDVAVLISYTGETIDMIDLSRLVRETGATVVTLTRFGKNTLSVQADIRLHSASSESMIRSGPMSSRIGQLAVIDILYTSVCSKQYTQVKEYLDKTLRASQTKHKGDH